MSRTAVIIPNYNMPESTESLCYHVGLSEVEHDIIVVNIGEHGNSPLGSVSVKQNVQMTHGILMGIQYSKYLEAVGNFKYLGYWILLTSTVFTSDVDVLSYLISEMENNPNCVMITPSFDKSSEIAWDNLYNSGSGYRHTWGSDCFALLYRADWYNSKGGYDNRLLVGWGVDLEMSYLAKREGKDIVVCDDVVMHKATGNMDKLGRMPESISDRNKRGAEEMHRILNEKYGANAVDMMGKYCKEKTIENH
jgi:hypothetical protein